MLPAAFQPVRPPSFFISRWSLPLNNIGHESISRTRAPAGRCRTADPRTVRCRRSAGIGRRCWRARALMAMVIAAYRPALDAEFIWDDETNVTNNETLRSFDGLRQMWFVPQSIQQYYPLMYTTYWVEYRLWGLRPFGYHLVNILLHGAAVLLVWRVLSQVAVPGAWLAAAIFAVHPVEVESVAWVTERKNVLSLSLALLSMLAYLRFEPIEADARARPRMSESGGGMGRQLCSSPWHCLPRPWS